MPATHAAADTAPDTVPDLQRVPTTWRKKVYEAVVPTEFFATKREVTPKASPPLLFRLALVGWVALAALFAFLFVLTYSRETLVHETLITQLPEEGLPCTALGSWSNKVPTLGKFEGFRSSAGLDVLVDIAMTTADCRRMTNGVCEAWADEYVGAESCCLMQSSDPRSECFFRHLLDEDAREPPAPPGSPPSPTDYPPPPSPSPPPSPTRPPPAPECSNTCDYRSNFECNDGGPGSRWAFCDLGTDCDDCGPRTAPTHGPGCADTCSFPANDRCNDGGPGSDNDYCELGTDCTDCGPRTMPPAPPAHPPTPPYGPGCSDSCAASISDRAFNGECEDGGPGSGYSDACEYGTDCTDCGARTLPSYGPGCSDSCDSSSYDRAFNGECEDGGPGYSSSGCEYGTDCTDCGPRPPIPMPPPPAPPHGSVKTCGGIEHVWQFQDWRKEWLLEPSSGTKRSILVVHGAADDAHSDIMDVPGFTIDANSDNPPRIAPSGFTIPEIPYGGLYDESVRLGYNAHNSLFLNISSIPRQIISLSTCSNSESGGGEKALNTDAHLACGTSEHNTNYKSAKLKERSTDEGIEYWVRDENPTLLVLERGTFVSDCQSTLEQVCSQADSRCGPYACTKTTVVKTTLVAALGTANANTQTAMGILFALLAVIAAKLNARSKAPETEVQVATKEVEAQPSDEEAQRQELASRDWLAGQGPAAPAPADKLPGRARSRILDQAREAVTEAKTKAEAVLKTQLGNKNPTSEAAEEVDVEVEVAGAGEQAEMMARAATEAEAPPQVVEAEEPAAPVTAPMLPAPSVASDVGTGPVSPNAESLQRARLAAAARQQEAADAQAASAAHDGMSKWLAEAERVNEDPSGEVSEVLRT